MKASGLIVVLTVFALTAFAMPVLAQDSSSSASPGTEMKQGAKQFYHGAENQISDAALTTKVKSALFSDKDTRHYAAHIHVDSSDGVVTLTGIVPNATAASSAQSVSRSVSGVKLVRNDLTVNHGS